MLSWNMPDEFGSAVAVFRTPAMSDNPPAVAGFRRTLLLLLERQILRRRVGREFWTERMEEANHCRRTCLGPGLRERYKLNIPVPCGGLPPVACQTGSSPWRLLS